MTCTYCEKADRQPDYPLYQANCKGCVVRAFACGYPFWQSKRDSALSPAYMSALKAAFGDQWKDGHEQVKAFAAKKREQGAIL